MYGICMGAYRDIGKKTKAREACIPVVMFVCQCLVSCQFLVSFWSVLDSISYVSFGDNCSHAHVNILES